MIKFDEQKEISENIDDFLYIKISYDKDFIKLIRALRRKYPEKLFNLDGIGDQLDLNKFSKSFFNTAVTTDSSIDPNSNVSGRSVVTYDTELSKPYKRLNGYFMLWKEAKRLYGTEVANEIIEKNIKGDIYIHDLHGFGSSLIYCFNYSMYDILTQGLPFGSKVQSIPPKHLESFKEQVEQFVIVAASSTLGATGLADFLVICSYFIKNMLDTLTAKGVHFVSEEDVWKDVANKIYSLIWALNYDLRASQSPFTNISIYDKYFLEKICDDYIFPDGTIPDINIINKTQEIFLDQMNKILESGVPITFPVVTACLSKDENNEVKDEDFLRMVCERNLKYEFINMYSGDSSTLSSCCFDGSQKVLTKDSNGVCLLPIKEIVGGEWKDYRRNFTIFHNGSWVMGKAVKTKTKNDFYKIKTVNNKEVIVTSDHIFPTIKGNKKAEELNEDDYLLFSSRALDSFPEKDEHLTYEQGFLIGLYAGDGSKYKREKVENYEITFSLNESNTRDLEKIKKALEDWQINKNYHVYFQNNVMFVKIYSKELFYIIEGYVKGNYAPEKEFDIQILSQSQKFRRGICDGWYASDGGNSNRIYSTSEKLIETGEAIFTSLGINTIIDSCDRTGKIEIKGKICNRNYPTICLRWYDMKNKRSMKNVYKINNNSEYFKISSIEKIKTDDEKEVYCFEILGEEPYFTLPNGIITHNCRLRSEQKSEFFNSFGAGSTKIGSLGVCSIDMPRLAFKFKNKEEDFFKELRYLVQTSGKINNAKRHLVKKRIDGGNCPLYTYGFMELSKQYSTVGVNGLYECMVEMGYDILDEKGQEFALKIIDTINEENDKLIKQYNSPHNCEAVPAENMAVKIAQKDQLLKYQNKYNIYSNQFIPLTTNADLLDRIKIQGLLDKHFSGGSILHINVDAPITDVNDLINLTKSIIKQGVIYHAINHVLNTCKNHHMTVGKNMTVCEICGESITDSFSRVVGFLTAIKNWIKTRREEDFPNRQFYNHNDL